MIAGALWVSFVVGAVPPRSNLKIASSEKARDGSPIQSGLHQAKRLDRLDRAADQLGFQLVMGEAA